MTGLRTARDPRAGAGLRKVRVVPADATGAGAEPDESRRLVRDSMVVALGGQIERALGTFTALALRRGLDPARLGVYAGLRLCLDNTNRSSLGVGLGAVQEIPILLASGREAEAKRVADVAHTANSLTCLAYALGLAAWAWWRSAKVAADPLSAEWTWGLVAIAGLTLLQRRLSFLVAVLRAHRAFALTTELDVIESIASAVLVVLGLWVAGFWGLLAGVGLLLAFKIVYLHARHPLRLEWAWDGAIVARLMRVGLPILANTAAFGAVANLDRVLILWRIPDGERALGLYSIAILGTSWSLDLAGRIVTVLYPYFQATLGRTQDPAAVARQAVAASEAQAPALAAGGAVAYLVAPTVLGTLIPAYAEGLPALPPLLPGMILLGLAWPARQMLIAVGRPYRLCLATLGGLSVTLALGMIGADRAGIVGVAWGTSSGFAAVYLLAGATAFIGPLGWRAWLAHQTRLAASLGWFAAGAVILGAIPTGLTHPLGDLAARCLMLAFWSLPPLYLWGRQHRWGARFDRGAER